VKYFKLYDGLFLYLLGFRTQTNMRTVGNLDHLKNFHILNMVHSEHDLFYPMKPDIFGNRDPSAISSEFIRKNGNGRVVTIGIFGLRVVTYEYGLPQTDQWLGFVYQRCP